jgi:hypothetical protein
MPLASEERDYRVEALQGKERNYAAGKSGRSASYWTTMMFSPTCGPGQRTCMIPVRPAPAATV